MSLEIVLSLLLTPTLLVAAYFCRQSFVSVHLAALGFLFVAFPLLRVVFGASLWPASDEVVAFTYAGVAAYAGTALVVSLAMREREALQFSRWVKSEGPSIRSLSLAVTVLVSLWVSRFYIGADYGMIFSGSANEEAVLELPYWLSTGASMIAMLGGGALIIVTVVLARHGARWLLIVVSAELAWGFVSGGRRELTFLVIVVLWIAWQARLLRLPALVGLLTMGAVLLYSVTPLFLVVRDANFDYLRQGTPPFDALKYAIVDGYARCGVGIDCLDLARENVEARTSVSEFSKSIVDAVENGYGFLGGAGILHSLSWAIPSAIFPKPDLMTEQFLQASFGLPLVDDAISVPALAYADLGLLGCVLAGACVALFVKAFARLAMKQSNMLLKVSMLFALVRILWSIEIDPLAFAILLRDSLLLILIAQCIAYLARLRLAKT